MRGNSAYQDDHAAAARTHRMSSIRRTPGQPGGQERRVYEELAGGLDTSIGLLRKHVCVFNTEPCYGGNIYPGLIIAKAQGLSPPSSSHRQAIRSYGVKWQPDGTLFKPMPICLPTNPVRRSHIRDAGSTGLALSTRDHGQSRCLWRPEWGKYERIDAPDGP